MFRFSLSFFITDSFLNWILCAAENPNSELIARTPLPDGTVEEVYKYTPEDDTPIVVKNPLDVLEKVEVSSLSYCLDYANLCVSVWVCVCWVGFYYSGVGRC